jgi:hypothetical protein
MALSDSSLHYSAHFVEAAMEAGFSTVEEYIDNSVEVPLVFAVEYITTAMSYPWFHSAENNARFYKLFHEASSWDDAQKLAATVKKYFTPKTSMVEPDGRIYREYETFHNFITPRLLVNKHAPTDFITLMYETLDFNVYNPKEDATHPLNIMVGHGNTSPHVLTEIGLMPAHPLPTNNPAKIVQEANLTFSIIHNPNTPYVLLLNPKFHNKIRIPVNAKMLLLTIVKREEYCYEDLKNVIYSTENQHVIAELRVNMEMLNLDESEKVFLTLTAKS